MCVPGRTMEVKLLLNFSNIPKICNIIPNKGALLNLFVARMQRTMLHILACSMVHVAAGPDHRSGD